MEATNNKTTSVLLISDEASIRDSGEMLLLVEELNMDENDDPKEPEWVNPSRERKMPYTDDELDRLVTDFICGLDDQEWQSIKDEFGSEERANEKIRAGFIKQDPNNLTNFTPEGTPH